MMSAPSLLTLTPVSPDEGMGDNSSKGGSSLAPVLCRTALPAARREARAPAGGSSVGDPLAS
jgi:hypothetical protein